MESDRIEKQVLLRAPIERVWRAISDSKEFGRWFGVDFGGPFVAGRSLAGRIVPTKVDAEVAKQQKPYEGITFEIQVEEVEPSRRLVFGWHPYAGEGDTDPDEPTTLVQLELQEEAGGTRLTVTESGFERIPEARRAKAYAANEGGWAKQMELIKKYLERAEGKSGTTSRRKQAARRNVRKGTRAAKSKRSVPKRSKRARTALGRKGAKATRRKRR